MEIARASRRYRMQTFWEWLSRFRLLGENYFTFDPAEYNELFDKELEKVIARTSDAKHRQALESMRGFGWISYIGAAVRHSGFRDYRDGQEKIHEIATKLLVGKLFRGFDERVSGPMDLRFKRSVSNAIKNLVEKERNRRHYLPTVPIQAEFTPGGVTDDDLPARSTAPDHDEQLIQGFRSLVRKRLGGLGVAVLQVRLDGGEVKSLVGSPALGSPGRHVVKRVVQDIKALARDFAASLGDPELLRRIEKAMAAEEETIGKRRRATATKQTVGA